MINKAPISSLAVTWLLLFPLVFFAARGRLSFERTEDNNAVAYSDGTLTATGTDSVYYRSEQVGIYGLITLLMCPTLLRNVGSNSWRRYLWITLLPAWAMVSCIWSQDQIRTVMFAVSIYVLTCFGAFIARRFSAEQQMDLVMFIGWCVLLASYGLALLYPAAGVAQFDGKGAWQGIFIHKNHCALTASLLVTTAFFRKPTTIAQRLIQTCFIVASGCLIVLTQSRTGCLLLGAVVIFVLFSKIVGKTAQRDRTLLFIFALMFATFAFLFAACDFTQIALALGKSSNLTGRTQIWGAILPVLEKRPFTGFGYQAFWIGMKGESANLEMATGYIGLANAENAVLQIWLELGIVGVALLLGMLWKVSRHAFKCIVTRPSPHVMWHSSIIFVTLLALVDGDKIMFPHTIQWVLFVMAAVNLTDERARIESDHSNCLNEKVQRLPVLAHPPEFDRLLPN